MPETIILQDGKDAILLTFAPEADCVHLKTVDKNGFTLRRDILPFSEHPELEYLHTPRGWYYPLIGRVIELYARCTVVPNRRRYKIMRVQPKRHPHTLPAFVSKHYGRAL
jgi:hypothetical protein